MSSPAYGFDSHKCNGAVAYTPEGWESPTRSCSDVGSPASLSGGCSSPPTTPPSSDSESELSSSPQPSPKVQAHVPRPRNAFIVFRSHFYKEAKARGSGINQNTLSCEAALAWRSLSDEAKDPFKREAEEEKLMHYKLYPNYIYTPVNKATKRVQKAKLSPSKKQSPKKRQKISSLSLRAVHRVEQDSTRIPRSRRSSASRPSASSSPSSHPADPVHLGQAKKVAERVEDGDLSDDQVDTHFGFRPDLGRMSIPPMPPPEVAYASPSTFLDVPTSLTMTNSSPSWVYNELVSGVTDTGIHAGWNPVQTTLDAYGDRYLYNGYNEADAYSQYISYDAMEGPFLVDGAVYPMFGQNAVWNGFL